MATRYLILVRHANTRPTADRPARSWPLTPAGEDRARQLAAHLRPYEPTVIITSSEPKAIRTGQLLAEALQLEVADALPDFDETDRDGVPYYPSQAEFAAALAHFFDHPADIVLGRESAYDARGRFANAFYELVDETPNGNILLVSHAAILSLFAAPSLNLTPYQLWQRWQGLGMPAYLVLTLPDLAYVALAGLP